MGICASLALLATWLQRLSPQVSSDTIQGAVGSAFNLFEGRRHPSISDNAILNTPLSSGPASGNRCPTAKLRTSDLSAGPYLHQRHEPELVVTLVAVPCFAVAVIRFYDHASHHMDSSFWTSGTRLAPWLPLRVSSAGLTPQPSGTSIAPQNSRTMRASQRGP